MTDHHNLTRRSAGALVVLFAVSTPVGAESPQATGLRASIERAVQSLAAESPNAGERIGHELPAQTLSNGRSSKRVARVIAGIAMAGGGVALAKWGYERPPDVRRFEVCSGPSFAPRIPGVPVALQQQINNLGNRCETHTENFGRTPEAVTVMTLGVSLSAIGAILALLP